MTMISLKELLLLKEMPRVSKELPTQYKKQLEDFLKVKFTDLDVFSDIEEKSIGEGYYIIDGLQSHIMDKWGAIIKKIDDSNIELCIGATFKWANYTKDIQSYQVMLINKYSDNPKRAASILYIYLVKKWKCAIFSDDRVTSAGKEIWRELLQRPNLKNEGVRIFIFDKNTKKEITKYENIDSLFGTDEKFEEILIGLRPL